jgi:hypothetical protein
MPRARFRAREANFRGHDFPVQAVLAFFAVAAVTKFSSDGSILQINATKSSEDRGNAHAKQSCRAGIA